MDYTNTSRLCLLVKRINKLNKYLRKKEKDYYCGGTEFDELYRYDINRLKTYEKEIEEILKNPNKLYEINTTE